MIHVAAEMLDVPELKLTEVLTSRSTFARGEMIVSPLISKQSVHVRDAFVKGIYGRIFEWIVKKINSAVYNSLVSTLFDPLIAGAERMLSLFSLASTFCFYL